MPPDPQPEQANHELALLHPVGYAEPIRSNGVTISPGRRQRVATASPAICGRLVQGFALSVMMPGEIANPQLLKFQAMGNSISNVS